MSLKRLPIVIALAGIMSAPVANADVGFGVGVSFVFGSGGGWAVGPKLFSDDEDDKFVGSLGVDYMIGQGVWRPNVGVGHQNSNFFGNANVGYDYSSGSFNVGVGIGATNTDERKPAPAPAPVG